jgi:methyl-accepting chemotaxis protein WspA
MGRHLDRLSIMQKIVLCSAIFALPIIVLLYYMVSGFNRNIAFSRLEVSGTSVLMPLQGLSELLPEHQLFARLYLEGDRTMEGRADAVAREIEGYFSTLQREWKKWERPLQITEKALKEAGIEGAYVSRTYKGWQELRAGWKNEGAFQSEERHEALIQSIRALLVRVGDTSNVVLDSWLDTYYMVDASLTVAKSRERLGELLLFAESVIYKGFRTQGDQARFSIFNALLISDLDRAKQSFQTALKETGKLHGANASLQKSLPPLIDNYESTLVSFLATVNMLANDIQYKPTAQQLLDESKNLLDAASKLREKSMTELQALLGARVDGLADKRLVALLLSLGTLGVASFAVLFITLGITRSIDRVTGIAREMARGDLRKAEEGLRKTGISGRAPGSGPEAPARKKARNEIARLFSAFATMTSGLASLLGQVGKSGIQVSASSTVIAASARELEATVAEQASSISEVSATSREISATSQEFASTMGKVARMAGVAAQLSNSSMAGLSDINATMRRLLEGTARSSAKLEMVSRKMEGITQVITTITKIANQINLLSLNAAIEAEKAGEQGVGFSVVAREIRRLADQTSVAALDIESMIVETQGAVKDGVEAVDAYTRETHASTERIGEISADLMKAIEHTRELVPQFETINEGMQMQLEGASHISEAMEQLNQASRQTKESLAEFRRVTEQLNEAVRDLQNEVGRFSVDGLDS